MHASRPLVRVYSLGVDAHRHLESRSSELQRPVEELQYLQGT